MIEVRDESLLLKRKLTVALISIILLFSTFTYMSVGVSAPTVRVYDFKDNVNNKAYNGSDPSQPPLGLTVGIELTSQDYKDIAYSDDVRAIAYTTTAGTYDFHRFNSRYLSPSKRSLRFTWNMRATAERLVVLRLIQALYYMYGIMLLDLGNSYR